MCRGILVKVIALVHDGVMTWWRRQMETFSALLAICAGNSPVPVNSPHKGQWRGALMFSLICVWINGWINNHEVGDLRRYRVHYDVIVMLFAFCIPLTEISHCRTLVLSFVNMSYWLVEQTIVSMLLMLCSNQVSAIHGLDTTLVYMYHISDHLIRDVIVNFSFCEVFY